MGIKDYIKKKINEHKIQKESNDTQRALSQRAKLLRLKEHSEVLEKRTAIDRAIRDEERKQKAIKLNEAYEKHQASRNFLSKVKQRVDNRGTTKREISNALGIRNPFADDKPSESGGVFRSGANTSRFGSNNSPFARQQERRTAPKRRERTIIIRG